MYELVEYVKGMRPPVPCSPPTGPTGRLPLTVEFTSTASATLTRVTRSRYEWDFGNGTVDSIDPNPTYTYTATGQYMAKLTVFDSAGKTGVREHHDHGRQHRADGDRQHAGRRAGRSPSATTSRSR